MVDKEKDLNQVEYEDNCDNMDTGNSINHIVIKPKVITNIDINNINVSREIS